MKIIQFIVCSLLAMFLCGFGCSSSKPTPDPLAGFKIAFKHEPDQTIVKDYQDYIQKLPPEERKLAYVNNFFEDGTGQHAIKIEIPLNGTWWYHILVYDKENRRIKVIKYPGGDYHS